ncbi:hypothetical protein ACFORO_10445 [Amycolatopsis halotolerans]|uniref:Uncharacterized protein n=1 Tax=Amycolatopsis halotolerans TaxID=330083 RepID=A0ABV7QBS6_9PSEU
MSAADDLEREARARLQERVHVMIDEAIEGYWRDVIGCEVKYFVREGPAKYLRYTDNLGAATDRSGLDGELRRLLGGGS